MKKQVTTNASTASTVSASLKEQYEGIKATETQPEKRTVKLIYRSCCGCGCDDIKVTRVVDFNSPLKNGDRIQSLEKGDKY